MSVLITSAVFNHSKALFGDRLVLLAIASFADNETRQAWPPKSQIAKMCKLSERQVQRAIGNLKALGELKVDHCAGPRGSNLFTILVGGDVHVSRGDTHVPVIHVSGGDKCHSGGETNGTSPSLSPFSPPYPPTIPKLSLSGTVKKPSIHPPSPLKGANGHSAPLAVSEDFKAFWSEYPRRDAMKDAVRAWNRANPKLEVVLEALRKAKKTPSWNRGKQYIPLPATYINGERWDDEL